MALSTRAACSAVSGCVCSYFGTFFAYAQAVPRVMIRKVREILRNVMSSS
jgi:hypothetical protein